MDGTTKYQVFEAMDQLSLVGESKIEESKMEITNRNVAILDGLNVAYARNDHHARLEDIMRIEKLLTERFGRVETFLDASGLHKIDDRKTLESLVTKGKMILCPARIRADDLIWLRSESLANRDYVVWIVTNDMFPMFRSNKKGPGIRNLTATIMRSGDIYLLEREVKYLETKPVMEVTEESVKKRSVSKHMNCMGE